jgi:hypothetical protein
MGTYLFVGCEMNDDEAKGNSLKKTPKTTSLKTMNFHFQLNPAKCSRISLEDE